MPNFTKIFNWIGINKGHNRTVRAKKNIAASFIIKGLNIAIGLMLVPVTINYLNPTKYGIWITLSSVIGWFSFFDIGLGNGLRNRFAEALANNDHELAKTYVSTTYAVLSIIIAVVLLLFYAVNPFINWTIILNTGNEPGLQKELSLLAYIVFTFFCLRFIFKLITTILTADQKPAKASLFDLSANLIVLMFIIILTRISDGSLLYVGIIFSSIPVIVLASSSFWFFNSKYRLYKPSIKFVDFSKAKDLFSLGLKFFIIQIAGVLLYQTNNLIISHVLSPAEVTPYNIAFKYFSVLMMVFAIIITPFWSAFTEAWVKKELNWIKSVMQKLIKLWAILILFGIIMVLVSPYVYNIWIGSKVQIPIVLSILVYVWVMINIWNGIFSQFLNGTGKIKVQLYISLMVSFFNIPVAIILGNLFGIIGIISSNIIFTSSQMIIVFIQYKKIINDKANGIWNE